MIISNGSIEITLFRNSLNNQIIVDIVVGMCQNLLN